MSTEIVQVGDTVDLEILSGNAIALAAIFASGRFANSTTTIV
jgi:hypothetical protein